MADQKLPHFIPRIQVGNRSPRHNSLQGWSCPFKCSLFPLRLWYSRGCGPQSAMAVPPGMQGTPVHGSTAGDAGHTSSWQYRRGHKAQPALAALPAGRASPATPVKRQEGNKAVAVSVGTVHGLLQSTTAPPAFPSFFSFHEGGRNGGDHFAQFPLRCKSGLKAAKRFQPSEE